jgi:hypothetical protein
MLINGITLLVLSTTQIIYINGVDVVNTTVTKSISTTTNVTIGKASYTNALYFDGQITEVGAYNRALTSLEVASLYNQGMPTNLLVNRNNYQSGNPTVFNTKQVDFDGTDDYLKANSTLGSFTGSISAWVKRNSVASVWRYIIDFRSGSGGGYFAINNSHNIDVPSGTVYVDNVATITVPQDNEWHHIVVTGITLDITESIIFGSRYNIVDVLNGEMSQVGLWNSTLTADEVSSLYNHGLPIDLTTDQAAYESSSNLVGYWRMGSGTLDSYPLIADQTNATLTDIITSDFSSGVDGFNAFGLGEIAGNISVGGEDNSLRYTVTASVGDTRAFEKDSALVVGKTYEIKFKYYIPSSNTNLTSIGTDNNIETVTDSWTEFTEYSVATRTDFRIFVGDGNNYMSPATTGDVGYIKNVSVKQVQGNPAIMTNQTSSDIENGSPYANVVINGNFATNSDWNLGAGQWVISNGFAEATNASNNLHTSLPVAPSNGIEYTVTFELKDVTSGYVQVGLSGLNSTQYNSDGTYSLNITSSGNNYLYVTPYSFNGKITNITATEVNTGLQKLIQH